MHRLRHPKWHLLLAFLCAGATCWFAAASHAGDKVILKLTNSSSQITLPCTIIDYTGTQITVQTNTRQPPKSYPTSQIIRVLTSYTVPHDRGLQEFASFQVQSASSSFEAALKAEPRVWVRREILSMLVRCALRLRDYPLAGARFLILLQSDPESSDFRLIPLIWAPETVGTNGKSTARLWLDSADEVANLMGASLLLEDSSHASSARRKLVELKRSTDSRIRNLAYTQLWRLKLRETEMGTIELQHWEKRIDDLPQTLRGGPFFILGRARRSRLEHEQAAAAWLWLPLVYDHDHQLAARACLQAADSLSRLGQTRQAATLFREVKYRFRDTEFAAEATELLSKLPTPAKPHGNHD